MIATVLGGKNHTVAKTSGSGFTVATRVAGPENTGAILNFDATGYLELG